MCIDSWSCPCLFSYWLLNLSPLFKRKSLDSGQWPLHVSVNITAAEGCFLLAANCFFKHFLGLPKWPWLWSIMPAISGRMFNVHLPCFNLPFPRRAVKTTYALLVFQLLVSTDKSGGHTSQIKALDKAGRQSLLGEVGCAQCLKYLEMTWPLSNKTSFVLLAIQMSGSPTTTVISLVGRLMWHLPDEYPLPSFFALIIEHSETIL